MKCNKIIALVFCLGFIILPLAIIAADANSIRFANEIITADNQVPASPASDNQQARPAPQQSSPLNDIAFISANKVTFNSLGLIIRNRTNEQVQLAIHDAKGRRVMVKSFDANQAVINIKTSSLKAGTYVYSVMIGDSLYSRPFIITP
jgi:hypothetical protein